MAVTGIQSTLAKLAKAAGKDLLPIGLTPKLAVFELEHMREITAIVAGAKAAADPRYWVLRAINSMLGRYTPNLTRKEVGLLVSRAHKAQQIGKWYLEDPALFREIFAAAPSNPAISWATDGQAKGIYGMIVDFVEPNSNSIVRTVVNVEVTGATNYEDLLDRVREEVVAGKYGKKTPVGYYFGTEDYTRIGHVNFIFKAFE